MGRCGYAIDEYCIDKAYEKWHIARQQVIITRHVLKKKDKEERLNNESPNNKTKIKSYISDMHLLCDGHFG